MEVFPQTYVSLWKNYLRKDNPALWIAIASMLLGIHFFLVWQGIYRALLYTTLYYKPIRLFLIRWFGYPPTMLEMPIPKLSFWVLVSILMKVFAVSIYIGGGIWLFTKVGFWGLNIFYILYQALK